MTFLAYALIWTAFLIFVAVMVITRDSPAWAFLLIIPCFIEMSERRK